jgi:hypothetical protein
LTVNNNDRGGLQNGLDAGNERNGETVTSTELKLDGIGAQLECK